MTIAAGRRRVIPGVSPRGAGEVVVRVNSGSFDVKCAVEELKSFNLLLKKRRVKKREELDRGEWFIGFRLTGIRVMFGLGGKGGKVDGKLL